MKVKFTATLDVDLAKWAYEYSLDPDDRKAIREDLLLALDNAVNLVVQDFQVVTDRA